MPADIQTSQSGERARARASSELHLLDLDDLCLSEILVRAVPPPLPWQSAGSNPFVSKFHHEGESVVYCGRVLRVCRRFRDALLSRATGRWVYDANALLRFAPRLRRLEIACNSKQLPWEAERSGDSLSIVPPALAHLTNVTQLGLRGRTRLDAGWVQDVIALPLLRDLEVCGVEIEKGPELQGLAALTALTRLHLPRLVAKSAPPDSLECFSRLQALQTFGAPEAEFASASTLRFIAALTALSALHLQGVYFHESDGPVYESAEHDAVLEIASDDVTADGFPYITRLTQLTVLDLTNSLHHLSERDLRGIAVLPRLRQLALTGYGCARGPPLSKLTALESLSLEVDEPSGVQRVAGLSALTHLRLRLQRRQGEDYGARLLPPVPLALGQPAIEVLATLSSLRTLALSNFIFDNAASAAVGALHGLRDLSLHGCTVTDGALVSLNRLHKLGGGAMEAWDMTQLACLTGLRTLVAGEMSIHLEDCAGIAMLTQLTSLDLDFYLLSMRRVHVPRPSLVELSRLISLQDLSVCAASIGQQCLDSMVGLLLLTRLSLSCTRAFTGTLSCLTALQRLVTFEFGRQPFVAAEDVAALACALPELRWLSAGVKDVPPRDSEVLARLAHLRGSLRGGGQDVELGLVL